MNLKGQRVIHILLGGKLRKYGTGTIVDSQNKDAFERIDVKIDTEEKVKTFSYPEGFGCYLMLENFELAKQIEDIQKVYIRSQERNGNSKKRQTAKLKNPLRRRIVFWTSLIA